MHIPDYMSQLRSAVRFHHEESDIYQASMQPLLDVIRDVWPDVDLRALGMSSIAFGYHMVSQDACTHVCVHGMGHSLLVVGDRLLGIQELREQVDS